MTEPSNHMISALRKTYWITNANSLAEKSLLNALPAVVFRGGLENIKRLTFQLKESCQICHHLLMYEWIILDLLKSRAVATWSKNIDSCIHAIRRFMCRRGQVSNLRSDNGTSFVEAERAMGHSETWITAKYKVL